TSASDSSKTTSGASNTSASESSKVTSFTPSPSSPPPPLPPSPPSHHHRHCRRHHHRHCHIRGSLQRDLCTSENGPLGIASVSLFLRLPRKCTTGSRSGFVIGCFR